MASPFRVCVDGWVLSPRADFVCTYVEEGLDKVQHVFPWVNIREAVDNGFMCHCVKSFLLD